MIENSSEKLMFEIVRDITTRNSDINSDQLYSILSKIVVNYKITKLDSDSNYCNLDYHIKQFLLAKQLDGLSKNTLNSYKLHLDIFSKDVHKNIEEITTAHIRNHLRKYEYLKPSSIASKISILKSFFGWLVQEEILQKDPMKKIKTPKYNKNNPKYLNVDELEMLREACKTPRQRALIEVLYATGCRVSEVRDMNINDIDMNTFSAKVVGKGTKEREVFFSLKAIHHLRRYLATRDDDCEALFVSERKPHGRLSVRGIQREISEIAKNSTVKKPVSPHVLRHTFATLSLNNNMDINVIKDVLGHSSVATTQIYSHVTDENKRYQYKKHLVL